MTRTDERGAVSGSAAAALRPRSGRVLGVDAARALALVGMFATHILPLHDEDDVPTLTGLLADGRASALFAVLAGVGVALATGGPRRPRAAREHLGAAASLVVRGLLVGLLGLWLIGYDSPVAVILPYYGLLFMVATVVLRLPAAVLAGAAVLNCALAPVLSQLLRSGLPAGPGEQPGLDALGRPVELFTTLALTGYYPVLPWATYLLAGMAVGRLDLRRVRVPVALLLAGTALAVAAAVTSSWLLGPRGGAVVLGAEALAERNYGTTPTDSWWWLTIMAPHSGTPFDLAHTTGTALAALGAMLLLARLSRALVWLPAAVGSIPLTLYTLHVLLLSGYSGEDASNDVQVRLWAAHVLGAVVLGVVLRLCGLRGPLEAVVSLAGRTARRAIDPRSGGAAGRAAEPSADDRSAEPTGPAGRADPPTDPFGVVPAADEPVGGTRRPPGRSW